MSERVLTIVAFATAAAGLLGAVANAIVQVIHCRRDKRLFKKAGVE